jgi:hypothetical protein
MAKFAFLRPVDQPNGTRRFINELQACLTSPDYTQFRFAVAFAKSGPLLRMEADLKKWRAAGKTIEGIFGIDRLGTSRQALEFALDNFDGVFVTHMRTFNALEITFHPKLYLFSGEKRGVCFYGSHNLTVGGTETNFEGGIKIEFELPADEGSFSDALDCWMSLLPEHCVSTLALDEDLLDELSRGGFLLDENKQSPLKASIPTGSLSRICTQPTQFPAVYAKPPSSLPRRLKVAEAPGIYTAGPSPITANVVGEPLLSSQTLVIQIVPHHNGEVFLSKKALNQNPAFFDYPFTGRTHSKKAKNPPYSQREPDPIVNVSVYNGGGQSILQRPDFHMNTVCYDLKGEVRVTFSPDIKAAIEPFSVMVMAKNSQLISPDYEISIFAPGSQLFQDYLSVCNEDLPTGGAAIGCGG